MKKAGILLIFILFLSSLALALDCPYGKIDDSYQTCGLYTDQNSDKICDLSQDLSPSEINVTQARFHTLEITIITTLIYLLSYFLVKRGMIQYYIHKKIWNYLLLVSFIIVALTSIAYLLRFDYNIYILKSINLNFWHIEIGLIMILISIFHSLWHLRYYINTEKLKKFFYTN